MDMDKTMIGNGRYEMSAACSAAGGMAEVRRAQDLRLGRPVAIKRLRVDLASDPTFQARFRREAQSAASLNHPTIVAVYDTGEEEATDGSGLMLPYIVMELVEGRTLRDILREGRRILPERALEITSSVLDALDYSHRAGIIHRDIKPANVMLTPARRREGDGLRHRPGDRRLVGDDDPDRCRGRHRAVPLARAGAWRAGRRPQRPLLDRVPALRAARPAARRSSATPRSRWPTSTCARRRCAPSTIDPEISPAIDAITLKALAKPVDQRYQSASEMRADIERALEGRSVLAPAVAAGEETQRFLPPPATDPTPTTETSAYQTEDRRGARSPYRPVDPARSAGARRDRGGRLLLLQHRRRRRRAGRGAEPPGQDARCQAEQALGGRQPRGRPGDAPSPATRRRARCSGRARHRGRLVDEGTEVDITYSGGPKTAIVPTSPT